MLERLTIVEQLFSTPVSKCRYIHRYLCIIIKYHLNKINQIPFDSIVDFFKALFSLRSYVTELWVVFLSCSLTIVQAPLNIFTALYYLRRHITDGSTGFNQLSLQ